MPRKAPPGLLKWGQKLPGDFAETLRGLRERGDPKLPRVLRQAHGKGWAYRALAEPIGLTSARAWQLARDAEGEAKGIVIPSPPQRPPPPPPPPTPTLTESEITRLRALAGKARTVNGGTPTGDPRRQASQQLTAELAAILADSRRGFTANALAKALGWPAKTLYLRLGRHGYIDLPPSQQHTKYKGTGPAHKLTTGEVVTARRAVAAGTPINAVARDLGVHATTVANAVHGVTWAHLTDPPPVPRE